MVEYDIPVAYVVCSRPHTQLSFLHKFIVTAAVIVDLAVEVSYFGAGLLFHALGTRKRDSSVDSIGELGPRGVHLGTGSIIRCIPLVSTCNYGIVCHSIDCLRCCPDIPATAAFLRTQDHSQDGWREVQVAIKQHRLFSRLQTRTI